MMLSPGQKLAVIEFRGREILVSASRNGLTRLAESCAENRPAGETYSETYSDACSETFGEIYRETENENRA